MTPNQLKQLGTRVYGPRWKYAMAADMGISREMLWRYETGVTAIGDHIAELARTACRKHVAARIAELTKLLERLDAAA